MSMLPPIVAGALQQLLPALASPDNNIRSQAEDNLNNEWIANQPDLLLTGLAESIRTNEDAGLRGFSAVLFRKMSSKTVQKDGKPVDMFLNATPEVQAYIKNLILQCFAEETVPTVRHKIGDAIAEVARQIFDENKDNMWAELLGALFEASKSPDASHREGAFRIFAMTPGIIEKQHTEAVKGAFQAGFQDAELSVRIAAIEAFSSFFRSIMKSQHKAYYGLLPEILSNLPQMKEVQDDDNLSKVLVALIDLAEVSAPIFKPMFSDVVKFGISIVQDKDLTDQTRQNALELLATFSDSSPSMCKKEPSYATEMVTQCLSLMTDIGQDDDDNATEWNNSDDPDDESDMNHVAGEQCMDRLAQKLGGAVLLPPTFNWLPRMAQSANWRDRHACLMAISAISEGCADAMIPQLSAVLEMVTPAVQDQNSRVRWAACNALGQMSTDFAGIMQNKYHHVVMQALIPALDAPEPRVKAHAAAALVNFCEETEKEILEPYLDELIHRLLSLLSNEKRYVQEQALSTIATVADSAETAFARYYDMLMPLLFNVINRVDAGEDKDTRLLTAKAMECASLIALAVGKERLGNDALSLVQAFARIQQNVSDSDDPRASYLLHCWGRMCRVMGNDFLPYLTGVMPPLIELASAKADVQLFDDDEQIQNIDQDEGWEVVPVRGRFIGIRTSTLEDKHFAIDLLVTYAQQLKGAFEPYVEKILKEIALPGLMFLFNDPVRFSSAKLVPQLLASYKEAHTVEAPQFKALWRESLQEIFKAIDNEPAVETLAEMFQCFYESVEVVGQNALTNTDLAQFVVITEKVLQDYQLRVQSRDSEAAAGDDDREDNEELRYAIEDDQTLLSDMNKAIHITFKNHGANFLPDWERLLPYIDQSLRAQGESRDTQVQWAICVIDDVIEFCGPASFKYQAHFLQPLMQGLSDETPANRQAAAYGVGIAAKNGGPDYAAFVSACLPKLFEITQHPAAREEEQVFATENACAAIAKILRHNNNQVPNAAELVVPWLETLPVVNDEEAAPYAYLFLAELIAQKMPAVMQNAPRIFDFIVQALEAQTLQGQTAEKVVAAGALLLGGTAGVSPQQILANMPESRQAVARQWFS